MNITRKDLKIKLGIINCEMCGKEFQKNNGTQRFCGSRLTKTGCSYLRMKSKLKKWRQKNPDYQNKWKKENPDYHPKYQKEYQKEYRIYINKRWRQWMLDNPSKRKEYYNKSKLNK